MPRTKQAQSRGRGRPTTCTKKIADTICRAIRDGNYQVTAFAIAGVPESTAYDWLARGETAIEAGDKSSEEQPFIYFSESIKKALAESESQPLKKIKGDKSWQSKAWYLERRFPKRWSLNMRIDQAAEKKAAQTIDRLLEVVSDDARREIVGILTGQPQSDSESSSEASESA